MRESDLVLAGAIYERVNVSAETFDRHNGISSRALEGKTEERACP